MVTAVRPGVANQKGSTCKMPSLHPSTNARQAPGSKHHPDMNARTLWPTFFCAMLTWKLWRINVGQKIVSACGTAIHRPETNPAIKVSKLQLPQAFAMNIGLTVLQPQLHHHKKNKPRLTCSMNTSESLPQAMPLDNLQLAAANNTPFSSHSAQRLAFPCQEDLAKQNPTISTYLQQLPK